MWRLRLCLADKRCTEVGESCCDCNQRERGQLSFVLSSLLMDGSAMASRLHVGWIMWRSGEDDVIDRRGDEVSCSVGGTKL